MSYQHGKFVWFEHRSAQPDKAADFYAGLFGWRIGTVPVGAGEPYRHIVNGDEAIGGLRSAAGAAQWLSYLSVADVDAAYAKALVHGAQAVAAPADFPPAGRGATLADPTGAPFAIWKGAAADRAETPTTAVGDWFWNELMSGDVQAALTFYESTFGFAHEVMDMGEQGRYTLLKQGDKLRGGLMHLPMADTPTIWVPYVKVADCDASAAKARKLGARVVVEPTDIPAVGRFASLIDPFGAMLAVMKPTG